MDTAKGGHDMLLRDMVHLAKVNGSIWSPAMIEQKARALGSIKRYQPKSLIIHEEEKLVFYNRVERFYLDVNFEKLVYADGDYYTEQEYAARFAVPLEPLATVSEPEYFNSEQLSRIETMKNEILRFYPYGQGDFIYNNLGIFRDGEDDRSMTIGFELETNLDLGVRLDRELIASNYLDPRLGHIESDSSITGVEFNSHIFTWKMLQKIKPLFEHQLASFTKAGLCATSGAGMHIHIGRSAFASEKAFQRFYYAVNSPLARSFWITVARREGNSYCAYADLARDNLAALTQTISSQSQSHGVAVNQQHRSTYEVRIFQSTLNIDVIYGCIAVLVKLIEWCNDDDRHSYNLGLLFSNNPQADKFNRLISYSAIRTDVTLDVSFLAMLSQERLIELVNEALTRSDTTMAMQYIQMMQNQQRRRGA